MRPRPEIQLRILAEPPRTIRLAVGPFPISQAEHNTSLTAPPRLGFLERLVLAQAHTYIYSLWLYLIMSSKGSSKSTRNRRPLRAISTSRSNNLSRSRMFSIAVQPPSQVRACRTLYPPIIAKGRPTSNTTEADIYYMFATAVLRDAEGNLLTENLDGTLSASGMFLEERRAGNVVFMFPDLAVPCSGTYSVRVDVYKVDCTGQGAVLLDQTDTRIFEVYDVDVPSERPCEFHPADPGSRLVPSRSRPSSPRVHAAGSSPTRASAKLTQASV